MYYQQKLNELYTATSTRGQTDIAVKANVIIQDILYLHARRKAASFSTDIDEVSVPRSIEIEMMKVPHVK